MRKPESGSENEYEDKGDVQQLHLDHEIEIVDEVKNLFRNIAAQDKKLVQVQIM